ncbi:ribonuclease Z [Porphyromonadaceae bacterium W3.11]|nr:ribonuclease Z [Porphyromonadaceae bacterium W3.11]
MKNNDRRKIIAGDGMNIRVLGSGSALPKPNHYPSSHVLQIRDKSYMIDCGEGTQMQMMRYGVPFKNLHRIFISHLHGDHCLGLPGLLSTLSLIGLDYPVHIYGPQGIKKYIDGIVELFCKDDEERIISHEIDTDEYHQIYEDNTLTVHAFPLKHRVKTYGYRFDERPRMLHLNREMADFYGVPMAYFGLIKRGHDYTCEDGTVIPNTKLTTPPRRPYSYAYCSDTAYSENVIPCVKEVDLLYHEATFMNDMEARAKMTMHSTTSDAARIASAANVSHLMIGHYSGRYTNKKSNDQLIHECQSLFNNTIAAEDGLLVSLEQLREQK